MAVFPFFVSGHDQEVAQLVMAGLLHTLAGAMAGFFFETPRSY
jgi:hypothetical protein